MQTVRILNKSLHPSSWPTDYCKWLEAGCYNREFEQYDRFLTPDHTFVDIGAWVGAHSLYAAQICKKVIAVEPDPVAFEILEKNASFAVRYAISDKHGTVIMGSGLLGASTTRTNPIGGPVGPWEEGQTFEVLCLTLCDVVEHLLNPLFIKIDVEGSEEAIFKDLKLFEERKPTVLVELHPWWWKDQQQTWKDFEVLKGLYKNVQEIFGNTWVLND